MRATAIFWATIIPIVFVGAVLYVIYTIRRTAQERRQRSDEREAALLANLQQIAPARGRAAAPATSATPALARPAPRATTQAAPASPALTRRARILTDTQRVLFLVLRAAMPDHLIMAHVRIVDLLDLPNAADAIERDARLRALAREHLDFVVCDSDLAPIAAIVLYEAGIEQVPDESTKIEALRALGIRFLRFRADRLPRPVEARNLVLAYRQRH